MEFWTLTSNVTLFFVFRPHNILSLRPLRPLREIELLFLGLEKPECPQEGHADHPGDGEAHAGLEGTDG